MGESTVTSTCYISCACNRTAQCADWGRNGLVCFGACHAVAIYKPKSPASILSTLFAHTDRVNAVRWVRQPDNLCETEFVSVSVDKSAIVWTRAAQSENFAVSSRLVGHTESVTAVDAIYTVGSATGQQQDLLVVTAAADSTVRVWRRHGDHGDCSCIQTLSFGRGFAISVALILLPQIPVPLLACGQDDQKIHLYAQQQGQFGAVQTLVGHEQWILGLEFAVDDDGDILLASCSQDSYIRLWRISPLPGNHGNRCDGDDVINNDIADAELKVKENVFAVAESAMTWLFTVKLESVLLSHENWVYSVHWQPPIYTDGRRHQPMSLLSASMDKTLIVWQPQLDSGVWIESVRVGDIGGSNLGFLGGLFSPDGNSLLALGFQGSFHMWQREEGSNSWQSAVTCGGHFGPVRDLAWGRNGEFLLSVGSDQTTRLHARWSLAAEDSERCCWHEIARPQIHGYDMQCIALIDRFSFVSGADEKILRVFHAPKNFLENFYRLAGADVTNALKKMEGLELAEGASVPALGLSNKAVFVGAGDRAASQSTKNNKTSDQYAETYFTAQSLTAPPSEENLLQNTLWPEVQKLYGHGNEVYAVACSPDGTVVASACKAAKPEHAAIIVWDAANWRPLVKLQSHSLTVTQLTFSHDGRLLLAVSRDRTWSLFRRRADSEEAAPEAPVFERVAFTDKKTAVHTRIIWSCSWSHDDRFFATVSRDKKAVVWSPVEVEANVPNSSCLANWKAFSTPLDLSDSITAVDFAPIFVSNDRYLLAFGLEAGTILLYTWSSRQPQTDECWQCICKLSQSAAHHLTVTRLRFSPSSSDCGGGNSRLQLASCSDDCTVKIHDIDISCIR